MNGRISLQIGVKSFLNCDWFFTIWCSVFFLQKIGRLFFFHFFKPYIHFVEAEIVEQLFMLK